MNKSFMRTMCSLAACAVMWIFSGACSDRHGSSSDPLTDELVQYEEIPLVTFNIVGTTICAPCDTSTKPIVGVAIQVVPKDNPLTELALSMFDNVGPFTISNLRYKKGATLTLHAHLYTTSSDIGYTKDAEVVVPAGDGETAAVTINF